MDINLITNQFIKAATTRNATSHGSVSPSCAVSECAELPTNWMRIDHHEVTFLCNTHYKEFLDILATQERIKEELSHTHIIEDTVLEHVERIGWLWQNSARFRAVAPIPAELCLTKENVLEIYPEFIGKTSTYTQGEIAFIIDHHNWWVRSYGIALWFKKDDIWRTNYPSSPIRSR